MELYNISGENRQRYELHDGLKSRTAHGRGAAVIYYMIAIGLFHHNTFLDVSARLFITPTAPARFVMARQPPRHTMAAAPPARRRHPPPPILLAPIIMTYGDDYARRRCSFDEMSAREARRRRHWPFMPRRDIRDADSRPRHSSAHSEHRVLSSKCHSQSTMQRITASSTLLLGRAPERQPR